MKHTFLNRCPWKALLRQYHFMMKLRTDHVDFLRKNISGRGTASAKEEWGTCPVHTGNDVEASVVAAGALWVWKRK